MNGPELIRQMNRHRVLEAVRRQGPVSRADLAAATGLTRPTISALVAELLAEGWLEEIGPGGSSGGRRPILLRFNPRAYLAIGVELSAAHVRAVLCDLEGQVLARHKERTRGPDPNEALRQVAGAIAAMKAAAPPRSRLAGAGFGITGLVDREQGIWRYSPHYPGPERPVAAELSQACGLPVTVENDARCLALGEYHFGEAKGSPSLIGVRVGNSIGAGMILDGSLYTGTDSGAGELGHVAVAPEGPRCACGRYGCLEAVAAAAAIARSAVRQIAGGRHSRITELVGGRLDEVLGSTVIAAATEGDPLAQEVLAEAGRYLGMAIGNLINLLNPTDVVIGGGTSRAGEFLLGPLREAALARALPYQARRVRIRLATHGEYGVALGAAALVIAPLLAPPAPT
ncbi:MAG: ROK family transcriptional regulator [Firmicutes bacterium]|nr:ROK family transcriptional regulator [Bacillota bacterium]